jgi:hypothetical protein
MEHRGEHLSSAELVKAVEQLPPDELERFADEVASLRARSRARVLMPDESSLFEVINRALPDEDRKRLEALTERRCEEVLTGDEHRELLELQDRLERIHAARMEALASLAGLRSLSLPAVMDELGIRLPDHG